jgi:DNA primase
MTARIDVDALRNGLDLVEIVRRYVPSLRKDGKEYVGRCPFHDDRSPSFYVSPAKAFVHCFGCGAHHDVIGFVMRCDGIDFKQACERLGARDFSSSTPATPPQVAAQPASGEWKPLLPVPDHAPDLLRRDGWTVPIWNPKRERYSRFRPSRADDYRDREGRLLGYVLRCEFGDGKITPTITWCIGPDGAMQWCVRPFPRPRPLYGLHDLAQRPDAPVLIPEGEKCRAAAAGALPMYVALSWPGGSKGIPYVDWSPLAGREIVLWPDADEPGREAMLGFTARSGDLTPGVAQMAHRAGARAIRYIDTEGQPKGWDLADALELEGWAPRQLATWAAQRVVELELVRG